MVVLKIEEDHYGGVRPNKKQKTAKGACGLLAEEGQSAKLH